MGKPGYEAKVYPACNGFLIPLCYGAKQPDFSERGHHYTILAYYSYTVMLYPRSQALTRKKQFFEQAPGNNAM